MSWQEGAKIGAYRILRPLGRGGMGEVYLAVDERLGREVAIKRIRPDRLHEAGFRARFRREARIVARLNHPAIVQLFDLLENPLGDGGDALVLEWVDGTSLASRVAAGPIDAGRLLTWGEMIARGLAAAHEQDLLHRDLKTANVLIAKSGQAKILDFGLARPLEDAAIETVDAEEALSTGQALVGTLATMSPEQARGEKLGKSSDLFSLGVLLYELARGRSPFQGAHVFDTLRKVQELEIEPLHALRPDLPAELCDLIARLLEKDPAKRPGSAAGVADALRQMFGSSAEAWRAFSDSNAESATTWVGPGTAAAASPGIPPRRLAKRVLGGLLLLGLGAGLAILTGRIASGPGTGAGPAAPSAPAARLLRVAVPPTQAGEGVTPLLLASVGIELQRAMLDFSGVVLFDPAQIGEISGGAMAAARAVAADEVIAARLFSTEGRFFLVLQRLAAADGSVVWAEQVEMAPATAGGPGGPGADALLAASAIRAALRRGYAELPLRPGSPEMQVSQQDYQRFLEVRRRLDAGRRQSGPDDLAELEAIGASSPFFADAHVLASTVALGLHRDSKNPEFLRRARGAVDRALPLGHDAPALLAAAFRLALAEGNDAAADSLLARLERERPGDPAIVDLQSRRLESQGRLDEAIALRRRALDAGGATWRELFFLADLEYRRGESVAAREHLRLALERSPESVWVLDKLGQVELAYGDLAEAERIYLGLGARDPRRGYFTNLGLTHYLAGRYEEAVAAYKKAEAVGGEHYALLLNLADAELARGDDVAARRLYARALEMLGELEARVGPSSKSTTSRAQCLLNLGRRQEAVALIFEALQKYPQEVEVQYHAALVLAAAGEKSSALVCARRALELGFPPRWLKIPAFASLRGEPGFAELLGTGSP